MASRKRVSQPAPHTGPEPKQPTVRAPPEPCGIIEALNPAFDPSRVLLRRLFFLNADKTKYVSIGFYPTRNYEPCVELGGAKQKPVILTQQYVTTLGNHLPDIVQSVCVGEQFTYSYAPFRINSTGSYKVTRVTVDKAYMYLKQTELVTLFHMFYVIQSQLSFYMLALPDVLTYVTKAMASTTYVTPDPGATDSILWYQLFDELKMPV
jgi:hypothetical protein